MIYCEAIISISSIITNGDAAGKNLFSENTTSCLLEIYANNILHSYSLSISDTKTVSLVVVMIIMTEIWKTFRNSKINYRKQKATFIIIFFGPLL